MTFALLLQIPLFEPVILSSQALYIAHRYRDYKQTRKIAWLYAQKVVIAIRKVQN